MTKYAIQAAVLLLALFPFSAATAQEAAWPSPEAAQLYTKARDYLSNGNLRQAIPLYQQAIALAPEQVVLYRDLANAWYLSGNYEAADKVITPVLESGRADENCYAVAASSKVAQKEGKKARKILSRGIEKYPHSGMLYHQWGKLCDDENDETAALEKWLAGIAADPGYRINYYEAARTYMITHKPVWAALYGEIFINLEPLTPRSFETRKLVMAAYRKIFTTPLSADKLTFGKVARNAAPANFEEAVTGTLMKLSPVVSDGISTENLVMLRTRFMIDWQARYAGQYPFTLFSYQEALLQNGYFDAYNQWLFGKVENAQQYEGWLKFHPQAMPALEKWMSIHPLRPAAGDYYNDGRMKGLFLQENPYKR